MYVLRFFFDYGGTCLWSANDAARDRFGYAVDLSSLPISDDLRGALERACARFDSSLNWDDPGGPPRWSERELSAFHGSIDPLLAGLRDALGADFQIRDERGRMPAR